MYHVSSSFQSVVPQTSIASFRCWGNEIVKHRSEVRNHLLCLVRQGYMDKKSYMIMYAATHLGKCIMFITSN